MKHFGQNGNCMLWSFWDAHPPSKKAKVYRDNRTQHTQMRVIFTLLWPCWYRRVPGINQFKSHQTWILNVITSWKRHMFPNTTVEFPNCNLKQSGQFINKNPSPQCFGHFWGSGFPKPKPPFGGFRSHDGLHGGKPMKDPCDDCIFSLSNFYPENVRSH